MSRQETGDSRQETTGGVGLVSLVSCLWSPVSCLMSVVCGLMLLGVLTPTTPLVRAAEVVIYNFEGSLEGWAIPDWARSSKDYVARECVISEEAVDQGRHALEIQADFPGKVWTGAYVERQVETTDWSSFGVLSADLYLPERAPRGLWGRIILTVGNDWEWTEMNHPVKLEPGRWTMVSANLKPGSLDWKFFPTDSFRANVRKIGIRIESDKEPAYHGSIFLDNVRLSE